MRTAAGAMARYAKSVAVGALIVGGATASLAMLTVMISLSAQLAHATFPAPNVSELKFAPPSAGPQSGSAGEATPIPAATSKTDEGASASVANAMTAVGTAVAAVTLILSVGTTWFALKLKDVEQATLKLENADKAYEQRLAEMSGAMATTYKEQARREQARQMLIDARFALRQWIDKNGAAMTRYSVLADLSAHLEMLMSQSTDQRQRSFCELTKFLPDTPGSLLAPVDSYTKHCHALHGGSDRVHGLWCDIFNPIERAAYLHMFSVGKPVF
jgi:hypothetical protein